MILVDTSVWIEFLRGTDDPAVAELSRLITAGTDLYITEPIIMELLAGAATANQEARISQLTNGMPVLPVDPPVDYRAAAQLFAASRRNGHPIRSLSDCLISAVSIRREATLFHRDRDFRFIAEIAPLILHQAGT
ncbi:MAG: type II toxin-antitoxin system VapC family toxin [Galactobacter sp.]